MFIRLVVVLLNLLAAPAAFAQAESGQCLTVAGTLAPIVPVAYAPAALVQNEVQLTYVGHSTFMIESPGGTKVATDYAGWSGGIVPDAVTMNRAHRSHYTDTPDPAIKHVLRGWNPDGGPVQHDLAVGDIRIRNVPTDIRSGMTGRVPDGNSIFIFEVAGLCIGHLGHLHHELSPEYLGWIGRLDIVLVPVDGGYTMAQVNMLQVLRDLKARIVIPMHYFGPDTLNRFLNGARADFEVEMANQPVLVVASDKLPEKPKLIVLPGS
jgi:L-ascorbate metabolism protein UlaG (beta-lactamase superfamily)